MDDIDLLAFGGASHASEAMFQRRLRILDEVRKVIAENGIEAVNMRELSRMADVSQRTLYNAFKNKDNIIALAIQSYFQSYSRKISFTTPSHTLEGVIERQMTITLRNVQIKNYLVALASIYYSWKANGEVRAVLSEIGQAHYAKWVDHAVAHQELQPFVRPEALLIDLSNLQYVKVHEWGMKIYDDDAFVMETMRSIFVCIAGAVGPGLPRQELERVRNLYFEGDILRAEQSRRVQRNLEPLRKLG